MKAVAVKSKGNKAEKKTRENREKTDKIFCQLFWHVKSFFIE